MSLVETLTSEHHLIRDYVDKIQVAAEVYGWGERPSQEFFEAMFKFSNNFIEKYHHIKEEEVLFPYLVEKLGGELDDQFRALENQHRQARMAMNELQRCLKGYLKGDDTQTFIFWRSLGDYTSFLRAHLNRENHMFFPLVEQELKRSEREEMENRFKEEEDKLGENYLTECQATLNKMTEILERHYGQRYRYLLDSVSSKRVDYQAA
jgi:hemerythrin-like domain-containing protein